MIDTGRRRPRYTVALAIVILGAAALLYAQTVTYTLTATTDQDNILRDIITANNEKLCTTLNAAGGFSCNQSQACAAAVLLGNPVPGGSACSPAQARNANVRIWPNTSPADRTEYISFKIAAPEFIDQRSIIGAWQRIRACLKWGTDDQTARNATCTTSGLPPNCQLFDPAVPCM